MKLHDLQVGQRFSFSDKHRGKVFEVADRTQWHVLYMDVATQQVRETYSNRETFRMEVEIEQPGITLNDVLAKLDEWIEMSDNSADVFSENSMSTSEISSLAMSRAYKNVKELIITGLPGRRVVLPDDPNGE